MATRKNAKKSRSKGGQTKKKADALGPSKPASSPREMTDEQLAQMWVLRAEGHSLRSIADQVGCAPVTVQREFAKDPVRHDALVRVQAEERAALWRSTENRSLKLLSKMIEQIDESLFTPKGRPRKLTGVAAEELLTRIDTLRKAIGPIRMTADSSTKMSQLLSGGATERVAQGENTLGVDPAKMSDDDAITLAVEFDLVDELPTALRERYERMREDGEIA